MPIWKEIHETCPRWFIVALGVDSDDFQSFDNWMVWKCTSYTKTPNTMFFGTNETMGHKITIHPCFLDKRIHQDELDFAENHLFQLGFERIEVQVIQGAGHLIHKILKDRHYTKEGTLRKYLMRKDLYTNIPILLDVDVYSKLKSEVDHG
jgi:hypothetical protein